MTELQGWIVIALLVGIIIQLFGIRSAMSQTFWQLSEMNTSLGSAKNFLDQIETIIRRKG